MENLLEYPDYVEQNLESFFTNLESVTRLIQELLIVLLFSSVKCMAGSFFSLAPLVQEA